MGRTLLLGALGAILTGAIVWSVWVWNSMPATDLGPHGTTALILGIVSSLVVGCGLMGLVFYSSRRGYDEQVRYDDHDE